MYCTSEFSDKYLTKSAILEELHKLDDCLIQKEKIILCGSSSIILQGIDFRATMDIDFATIPSKLIQLKISNKFDLNSSGVISLLEDFDDRLIEIRDNFKYLIVLVLDKRDWVVSKLASPKLEDIWESGIVTVEDINWVSDNLHLYGGINESRANRDLDYVIKRLNK